MKHSTEDAIGNWLALTIVVAAWLACSWIAWNLHRNDCQAENRFAQRKVNELVLCRHVLMDCQMEVDDGKRRR